MLPDDKHTLLVKLGAVEYLTELLDSQTERTIVTGIIELFLTKALDELLTEL